MSIYRIFKYLQYFHLLFTGILIVVQLRIEKKKILEDEYGKSTNLNLKIRTPILHGFSVGLLGTKGLMPHELPSVSNSPTQLEHGRLPQA